MRKCVGSMMSFFSGEAILPTRSERTKRADTLTRAEQARNGNRFRRQEPEGSCTRRKGNDHAESTRKRDAAVSNPGGGAPVPAGRTRRQQASDCRAQRRGVG